VHEPGVLGAKPSDTPFSMANGVLAKTAVNMVSVPELFSCWLQPGRVDAGPLRAHRVGRMGNINGAVPAQTERALAIPNGFERAAA
jgi:glutaconate CoA-transferase subunit B